MSVFKYFKNIPRSPPIGRQGLSVIFFSSNLQRGPWKKRGACRPLGGRQGPLTLSRHMPPFPLSFEPKNSEKSQPLPPFPLTFEPKDSWKKLEWLPCCHIFLKWWKGTVIGSRMSRQRMRHLGNPWSPCWAVATCDLVLAARYTMVPILSYSSV